MGACKATIPHLFHSSPPPLLQQQQQQQTPSLNPKTTRRRLLLISLPVCFVLIGNGKNASSSGNTTMQVGSGLGEAAVAESYDPVGQAEKEASAVLSRRISEALQLLEKGRESQAQGDFNKALLYFTLVVKNYKDFAFSEYARVGRALALYEVGDREEAIAEMEDVSISLKGYPEVHAALAAALYADKHAPLLAENQFAIATVLDPRYTDLSYVKETKHWPPSLVSSLHHFITLS